MNTSTSFCVLALKAIVGLAILLGFAFAGWSGPAISQQLLEYPSLASLLGFDSDVRSKVMDLTLSAAAVCGYLSCIHMLYRPGTRKGSASWRTVASYAALGVLATLLIRVAGVWPLKLFPQAPASTYSVSDAQCKGLPALLKGASRHQIFDLLGPPFHLSEYSSDSEVWLYATDSRSVLSVRIRNGFFDSIVLQKYYSVCVL